MHPCHVRLKKGRWCVYLLRCADGSLYCGITNELKARIATHNKGRGAKYTRSRLPVRLAYVEAAKARFSAKWLKAHRARIKLSADQYARLVGVTGLTIYNWERGKGKPSKAKLPALFAVRGIGRRDALKRLELIGPVKKAVAKKTRKPGRKVGRQKGRSKK